MDYPDYDPALESPPLAEDELDALDDLLRALPADAAMNVEAMDGYLTALLVGPPLPPTAAWMPAVWGGDGEGARPFASQKQRKKAVVAVLRHLHAVDVALRFAVEGEPERWEPVVSVADTPDGERIDAEDWCAGFLQAVALDAESWAPVFDDPDLGPRLVPLALLGADPSTLAAADAARLADPLARDELGRAALDAVLALAVWKARAAPGATAGAAVPG